MPNCPKCGGDRVVKNGKTAIATQKYKCNDCGKGFSDNPAIGNPNNIKLPQELIEVLEIQAAIQAQNINELVEAIVAKESKKMPKTRKITNLKDFYPHFKDALERAEHHGSTIKEILILLPSLLYTYSDKDWGFKVTLGKSGVGGGNALWFKVKTKLYYLRYDHDKKIFELLRRGQQGEIIGRFDNSTEPSVLTNLFASLS